MLTSWSGWFGGAVQPFFVGLGSLQTLSDSFNSPNKCTIGWLVTLNCLQVWMWVWMVICHLFGHVISHVYVILHLFKTCNILLHHKCRICMCETGFDPLNSKRKGIPFRVPDIPAMPVFEYLGLWHFEGEPTWQKWISVSVGSACVSVEPFHKLPLWFHQLLFLSLIIWIRIWPPLPKRKESFLRVPYVFVCILEYKFMEVGNNSRLSSEK